MPVEDLAYDAPPASDGWTTRPNGRMWLAEEQTPQVLSGGWVGAGAAGDDEFWSIIGSQDPAKAALWAFARGQIGRPYSGPLSRIGGGRFGDPGYDCSSFVSAAYRALGVNLTPFTDAAAGQTTRIDPSQAQPGDIVFYRYADPSQPNVTYPHMGIFLGNGQMIDASYNTGVSVRPLLNMNYEIRRAPGVPPPAVASSAVQQAQVATQDPLSRVGQIAQQAGLDAEGQRVAMAVATVEGGLRGAVGPDPGGSYGAFQFTGGKLADFARSRGLSVQDAGRLLQQDPLAGVGWALDGYLGKAIREGQQRGLHGAELATYAQQYGQVSTHPERAGNAYNQLATHGAPISQTTTGQPTAPTAPPPVLPPKPPPPIWETYTPEEQQGVTSMYQRQFGEQPTWGPENQDWQQAALGMYRAGQPVTTMEDLQNAQRQYESQFGQPFDWRQYQQNPQAQQYIESALGMSRAQEMPWQQPVNTSPSDWQAAQQQYEQQFGQPLDWQQYDTNPDTYQYIESALGMSRAGELPQDWYTSQDETEGGDTLYTPEEPDYGFGQDVGAGADWWDDFTGSGFGQFVGGLVQPVMSTLGNIPSAIGESFFGSQTPYEVMDRGTYLDPWEEQRRRDEQQQDYGWSNPVEWGINRVRGDLQDQNPIYNIQVIGGEARLAKTAADLAMGVPEAAIGGFQYGMGVAQGLGQVVGGAPGGEALTYDWGPLGGQRTTFTPRGFGDVFDPAQARGRYAAQTSPILQTLAELTVGGEGMGLAGGLGAAARAAEEVAQLGRERRFLDVPQALGLQEDVGRLLNTDTVNWLRGAAPVVGGIAGFTQGDPNDPNNDLVTRVEHAAVGAAGGLFLSAGITKASSWLQQGAADYKFAHFPEVAWNDSEILRLQRTGGDLSDVQVQRLQEIQSEQAEARDALYTHYPRYQDAPPAVQDRINQEITDQLVTDKIPLDITAHVPATGEYPYLRQAVNSFAKSFMDRQGAMGVYTDMMQAGMRSMFGSNLDTVDNPLQMLRAVGATAAEIEDHYKYSVAPALQAAGVPFDNRPMARDFFGFEKSVVAMSRALGTMDEIDVARPLGWTGPFTPRDKAREVMRGILDGQNPMGNWEAPGFKATGELAQSPMQAAEWFASEGKWADELYGTDTGKKWLQSIVDLDDRRADLVRAYEAVGGLAPGEAQRIVESNGVYGFVQALGANVDATRLGEWNGPGRIMVDESAIGNAYSADKMVKYGMESTLRHDADLISDTKQLRVFAALRNAREQDLGGFADFMRPLKTAVENPEVPGTDLVDEAGNTVMRWLTPEEANARGAVPAGWGTLTGRSAGVPETYLVPADLRDALLTMTPGTTDRWIQMAGKYSGSQLFRMGVTTASLPFILANTFRDFQSAIQNTDMPLLFMRNYLGAAFDAFTGGFDEWMRANPDHPIIQGLPQRIHDSIANALEGERGIRAFQREAGQGTITEVVGGMGRNERTVFDQLGFVPEGAGGNLLFRTLKTPFDVVQALSFSSELTTRLAVYRAAIDAGKTAEEAGSLARSTTVDFSRGGEFFKTFGVLMPLVNARLQGSIRSAEALQADPVGFAHRLTLGAVIPQVLTYAYNRSVYGDLYDDVPVGDKDRNFILGYGVIHDDRDPQGKDRLLYHKIPKSEITALVTNPVENMLDAVFHVKHGQTDLKDTQRTERSAGQMWLSQLANLLPISQRSDSMTDLGTWFASALEMNPLVGMALQLSANRDSFLDRPIIPDDQMLLPPEYRKGPNGRAAPWGARALSQLTKALGLPQELQPAPPQIAFAFSHLGGTAGTMLLGSTDLIWNAFAKAGAPLPAFQPTSVEDLKLPKNVDPVTAQMYYDALNQTDFRPWQVGLVSRFFGMGGTAQTITAKVNQLSPNEKIVWQDTLAADAAMRQARNIANDKIDKILNDPNPNVSMKERYDKMSEVRQGLHAAEDQILRDHPRWLQSPNDRDAFVAALPGVPIDVEKFRPASANLPADVPVAALVAQWDNPPGVMMSSLNPMQQNAARQQSLANMARQYDVPQSVLRDYIMASKLNNQIPSIPVPAVYLDRLADRYTEPPGDYDKNDADAYYQARRAVVTQAAQEWGVPEQVVLERLQARLVSSQNTSPLMLSRERALDAYAGMKNMPAFVDPQGNPVGVPEEWPAWEQNVTYWKQKEPNRPALWPEYVRVLAEAQANAKTAQTSALIASPNYSDYQQWFGYGKDLSPQEWTKYQTGESPRYQDHPGVAEETRRDGVIRLFQVLPANSPQKYALMREATQYRRLLTPGWLAAMKLDDLGQPINNYDDLYS